MPKQNLVVLPEPEMVLPDDKITPAHLYRAESVFFGRDYQSVASMIEGRKRAEARLNNEMADWQRAIAAPAFVMYSVRNDVTGERLLVYGLIPTLEQFLKSDRADGITDLGELRRVRKRFENAHQRGWLYGKWYSRTQPDGDWGVMHRSYIQQTLSEGEFLQRGKDRWE